MDARTEMIESIRSDIWMLEQTKINEPRLIQLKAQLDKLGVSK